MKASIAPQMEYISHQKCAVILDSWGNLIHASGARRT